MRKRWAKFTTIFSVLIMAVAVLWFANQWFGWFSTDYFSRPAPRDMRPPAPFSDVVWGAGVDDMLALYGKPLNYNGSDNAAYASLTYQRQILGQPARARYEWQDHKLYHAYLEFSMEGIYPEYAPIIVRLFTKVLGEGLDNPKSMFNERRRANLPFEPEGTVWFYDAYLWDENSLVSFNSSWSAAEQRLQIRIALDDALKYGRERWMQERSAMLPDGPARLRELVAMPFPGKFMAYPWGSKFGVVKKDEGAPGQDISFPFYGGWREYYKNNNGFAYTVSFGFPWRKLTNIHYNARLYGIPQDMAEAFADGLTRQISAELGQPPQKTSTRDGQSNLPAGAMWRSGANWLTDETFVFFSVMWDEFGEYMTCYLALGDVKAAQNESSVQLVEQNICEAK